MSPRKLTEDDKNNILQLYRNSEATTSTLAQEFGVSSSTVSRFLKNSLSQDEYEDLIQQKRLARTTKVASPQPTSDSKLSLEETTTNSESPPKIVSLVQKSEPISATELPTKTSLEDQEKNIILDDDLTESETEVIESPELTQPSKPQTKAKPIILKETSPQNLETEDDEDEDDNELSMITLEEMLGEEVDEEEDEDEDDDDDDWELETDTSLNYPHTKPSKTALQILPLTQAPFPKTCYVVIDRAAELITRPLKDFADLGSIPQEETQQKTLPIFDNHRVAKRFSHRRAKVIKVPDGQMLEKTSRHLYSKGITRLLIDGQIYAVSLEN
ncbi:MAG: hypothetical protein QNJ60_20285 [Xenococcaceae cyanobacterium MO_188.B19]|nr:hypothetical protein [Xenococcaceae cyanobacterium MO_188.B19]MDJ0680925.1 hypothetical protein [Xenococcaceae cyanobacterium MO_167.B52]